MPIPTLDGLRNMKADQLRSSIVAIDDALVALDQDEAGEMRSLSDSEQKRLDNLLMLRSRAEAHLAIRKQVDGHPDSVKPALARDRENGSEGVRRDRRDIPPLLTRNQSVSDWVRRGRRDQPEMSFAKIARGLATGIWTDAELEQRAIAESPATAGGHMVPTPVAATVIDKGPQCEPRHRSRRQVDSHDLGYSQVPAAHYGRSSQVAFRGWRDHRSSHGFRQCDVHGSVARGPGQDLLGAVRRHRSGVYERCRRQLREGSRHRARPCRIARFRFRT
jgi:hypothetical protein